jgi:sensor histidine kinase YesM
MQIMLSQIQQHILYNTLSAIQYLCAHDPKAAGETTEKFSRYLQGNMSALRSDGEIPFERELEHTKIYLEIEQIRFEDALQVEYDIACTEFSLPTLTLQPIAENAVRHGVRGRKGVGTVRIATREYPDRWEITVADDGPGFDPEAPVLTDDGREHIGISNVRDRLERISGGTLQIRSAPGSGAVVTIAIPKKEKAK